VWTGAGLGTLAQVPLACNDDVGGTGGITSALNVHTTPGVTYFIRVSSKVGAPSHLTFNLLPSSTIGASPIQSYFTSASPTLSWNRVTDATEYNIQVSKSALFMGVLDYTATVPSDQLNVTVSPLAEGVYYWRVRAITDGVVGGWSAIDSFIVDLP